MLAPSGTGSVPLANSPASDTAAKIHAEPVPPNKDMLQQASDCLERGDEAGAVRRLNEYVEANPSHALVRAHLAELLIRQDRRAEAKRQFIAYVELAQQQGEPADRHLLLSHTRLAEIARDDGDAFAEHLHRGIGLWLLARQVRKLPDPGDDSPDPQPLLFKAVRELKKAAAIRNDDARPHWYLNQVWSDLGQHHPAVQSLRRAKESAPLTVLTATERLSISLESK